MNKGIQRMNTITLIEYALCCITTYIYTILTYKCAIKHARDYKIPTIQLGQSIYEYSKFGVFFFVIGIIGESLIFLYSIFKGRNMEQGFVTDIQIGLALWLAFIVFCLTRVETYVRFKDDGIWLSTLVPHRYPVVIKYKDVTFYEIDDTGNISLYHDSQCLIKFALKNRKEQIIRELDDHHVRRKE